MRGDQRHPQRDLIYTTLPVGSFHGWGICGKYLIRELSRYADIRLVAEDIEYDNIKDDLDYRFLTQRLIDRQTYHRFLKAPHIKLNSPVIQSIVGNTLRPLMPNLKGSFNLGYTFFEENILNEEILHNGRRFFDYIVTGSSWNEEVLRFYGLNNVKTIIQGIDPTIFNPLYSEKEYFLDSFVVFSGGKFELRKGQDLVIRAFRYLQDRYDDVLLVTSWFNHWPESLNTMSASPYIKFSPSTDEPLEVIRRTLHINGIDLSRVIVLPPLPNVMMARIYKNTDVGLFPNRCEGGTNLVLMEYMACGKPAIASYNTGHRDVLTEANSIMLRHMTPLSISDSQRTIAQWFEPSLEEVFEALDWAYKNTTALTKIARQAGRDMAKNTWRRSAEQFYGLIKRTP